jgi:thioredoxin reductase
MSGLSCRPPDRTIVGLRYDVIIVGGGPAGLSAALILGRCLRKVILCDSGRPRNAGSEGLHGYLTRDGVHPLELLRTGRAEAARYGVEIRDREVVDAQCRPEGISVKLDNGTILQGRKLLVATGVIDRLPEIEGMKELFGKSVHHCPYCDGWEYRGQAIAVYGGGSAAVGLALSLLTWTRNVTVCSDGQALSGHYRAKLQKSRIGLRTEKIVRLEARGRRLHRIVFERASPLTCRGLFLGTGQVQRSTLAGKLGCRFDDGGHLVSDSHGRTRIPNLFLAGDANGHVQFAIVAAAEGASAAVAINTELQKEDLRKSW